MTAPRWAGALLRRLAPPGGAEDVLGDLEEAHHRRVRRRGPVIASLLTSFDALDMAAALIRGRMRGWRPAGQPNGSEVTSRSRGRNLPSVSWLDFKLGFRMLAKYPGLTLVGGFAMSFAIWVGAAFFEPVTQVVHPTLPLDEGDRVVGIRIWDAVAGRLELRASHDFLMWRWELESVADLGAFGTFERNLITAEGLGEPVEVAEISASAFRVARVPPLLGRSLIESDEQAGTTPVVVIGHDVWQSRFGGDPDVVGRIVRLGSSYTTVVGVMPEGFAFPVSQSLWVPLRLNVLDHEWRAGPAIRVFGRLAPGVTLDEAQAELTTLGLRAAADHPSTHEHLRPQVVPYAQSIMNVRRAESAVLMSSNVFVVMLLVLVCGNVALLMFARAATRESEIVVRNALGATRGRIIGQLFAEALVLGGVAALVGLAAAGFGLRWVLGVVEAEVLEGRGGLPFWFRDSLAPATVLYAGALTLFGAAVAGVLPALKVTGRGVQTRLREASAGGGGLRFGGLWTGVIVTQVAATVVFTATAYAVRWDVTRVRSVEGFRGEEYLSVRLEADREAQLGAAADTSDADFFARFAATYRELERRLAAEPGVLGVTFADRLPRMYHPWRQIEVDEGGMPPPDSVRGHRVGDASVDLGYFDVLGTSVLSGRGFHSGDLESGVGVVIVNQSFVDRVLGGRNPIGRRARYVASEEYRSPEQEPGPWYEIVGLVGDLGMNSGYGRAGLYHPIAPGGAYPLHMAVRVRGEPESFAPRLRVIATAVDPALRLHDLQRLDQLNQGELQVYAFWFRLTVLVSAIALLLSLAGIYSVMSFTVSRQTREIGIRIALGSDRRRIALAIFQRPLAQVALGVVVGSVLVAAMARLASGGVSAKGAALVVAYAALMMGVCMLACMVPTRRALRVEPTEALRADG